MSSGPSKAPDKTSTSPPTSPPFRPVRSRNSSVNSSSGRDQYAPTNPSRLRTSIVPDNSSPPDDTERAGFGSSENPVEKRLSVPYFLVEGINPGDPEPASAAENDASAQAEPRFSSPPLLSERNRLLTSDNWDAASGCGSINCKHGTFSPRPGSPRSYGSDSINGFADRYVSRQGTSYSETGDASNRPLADGDGRHMSTTQWLAKKHGIKMSRLMYLSYYVPLFNWVQQYRWAYVRGDLVAALTMASFYIPMSLSYASNLGHVPPVSGLYSFVFNPLIYAVLGTCPQMVVGPEAAGSLLTGQVVRENINKGRHDDDNDQRNAEVAGIVTFIAGAVILLAGLFRLGFLDNVLSRPFLRGFISAIGIVIFVDQLIPEMGLSEVAAHTNGVAHGSTLDKAIFIVRNIHRAHGLTCAVSFGAFAIILVCRELKKRLQPRYPSVAYIPDRFLIVVLSAVFAWRFDWESQGLDVMGDIKAHGRPFPVHFPFGTLMHLQYASDAFSTAFAIALLGFFESSVAAKSLGTGGGKSNVLKNMNLSANRELVALGVANVCGGLFMALPAFGGYGRSKVNASTGGKTPMSSIFLCIITIICIFFLLPYFYHIPVRWHICLPSYINRSRFLSERRPLRHDIRRRLLPPRRNPSRPSLLPLRPRLRRLPRASPHDHHLPLHHLLESQSRHRSRHRPLPPSRSPPRYPSTNPDSGESPWHQGPL